MSTLLGADEPDPVTILAGCENSPFVLTCDHAANRIPRSLANLGLTTDHLQRHIAWDVGAAGVAQQLARHLNATLLLQNYSRLVIDCNRPLDSDQLVPCRSEETKIPGNEKLSDAAREHRCEQIFVPYHEAISQLLERRKEMQQATIFVAIHSFTPVYLGRERPWQLGILYGADRRVAASMFADLAEQGDEQLIVGENEPYKIDHQDYGIPIHGDSRGLPNVLIELRQDLIACENTQRMWATRLARLLRDAAKRLSKAQV